MKHQWIFSHSDAEHYDFTKSLQNFEDHGDTDIEVHMTFNIVTRTAAYVIVMTNDSGNTVYWEKQHHIKWDDAINTIHRDGCDNFPEKLKEKEMKATDLTDAQQYASAKTMEKYGGGFASALALAFSRADLTNRATLLEAFSPLFMRYHRWNEEYNK